ncbi:MAG: JAB domain-containing protein [bacterium]
MTSKARRYLELMEAASSYIEEVKIKCDSPEKVADFLRPIMRKDQEVFYSLYLGNKHHLLDFDEITKGLIDRTHIHTREVFRQAIVNSSLSIVLAHNHPSGNPFPSHQDIDSTKTLVAAGKILGIEVLDHVIVVNKSVKTPSGYYSFRENGHIN